MLNGIYKLMPSQADSCHFFPVEKYWATAHEQFQGEKKNILRLLLGIEASVEHIGGTSVPGGLTRNDLDIHIRVAKKDFLTVVGRMKTYAEIKNSLLPLADETSFKSTGGGFFIDYTVTIFGSKSDKHYSTTRDLLINDPRLLQRYNKLKSSFEEASYVKYRAAKKKFWHKSLKERLDQH